MIRRWSCVNSLNFDLIFFNKFLKAHKLQNFKTSVSFKRFSFKFTKFRRRTPARWRHKSSWLPYTNVLKPWAEDYRFRKQYAKFQFFFLILPQTFLSYNFNSLRKRRNQIDSYTISLLTFSLSRRVHLYFYKNSNFLNFYRNINLFFASTPATFETNDAILPLYSVYNKYLHSKKPVTTFADTEELFFLFTDIAMQQALELYKLLLLVYLNLVLKR